MSFLQAVVSEHETLKPTKMIHMIGKQSIKPKWANIKTKPDNNSIQRPGHQTLTADCSETL